jgi:hypothetical protein
MPRKFSLKTLLWLMAVVGIALGVAVSIGVPVAETARLMLANWQIQRAEVERQAATEADLDRLAREKGL